MTRETDEIRRRERRDDLVGGPVAEPGAALEVVEGGLDVRLEEPVESLGVPLLCCPCGEEEDQGRISLSR